MDSKENDSITITLDHTNWDEPNNANEIYISDFDSMLTSGTNDMPTITIGGADSFDANIYTTGINTIWQDIIPTTQLNSTMELNGEDADIKINGQSLMETLRGIQAQLNMLQPNPELEREWDELRAAGDHYRELERQIKEKSKMWNALKEMPPPEIT